MPKQACCTPTVGWHRALIGRDRVGAGVHEQVLYRLTINLAATIQACEPKPALPIVPTLTSSQNTPVIVTRLCTISRRRGFLTPTARLLFLRLRFDKGPLLKPSSLPVPPPPGDAIVITSARRPTTIAPRIGPITICANRPDAPAQGRPCHWYGGQACLVRGPCDGRLCLSEHIRVGGQALDCVAEGSRNAGFSRCLAFALHAGQFGHGPHRQLPVDERQGRRYAGDTCATNGWSRNDAPMPLAPPGLPSPVTCGSKNSRLMAMKCFTACGTSASS